MSAPQQTRPAGKPERITFVVTGTNYRPTRREVFTRQERRDTDIPAVVGTVLLFAGVLSMIFWRQDMALVFGTLASTMFWHEAKMETIAWRRAYAQSAQVIAALAMDETERGRN